MGGASLRNRMTEADEKIEEKRGTGMAIVAIAPSLSKPFMTAREYRHVKY
jgi:hypothetical protein